jgi:hypothetical protein
LAAQTIAPQRTIIVVREDDRETRSALRDLRAVMRFAEVLVGKPGAVAAIEAGVGACTEDVVAITDDDAVPRPDWLERLRDAYRADIGGVGGRDIIEAPSQARASAPGLVGRVTWFGRLHGNHHLGVGPARDVDVLKGANMSLRRELWQLDGDLRGQGAQVHWEVGVCLRAKNAGWRLVYDPDIQVDHYPGHRYDADDRETPTVDARVDAEWNFAYISGRYFELKRLPFAVAYRVLIGSRSAPGVVTCAARCLGRRGTAVDLVGLSVAVGRARVTGTMVGASRRRRRCPPRPKEQ